LHIVFIFFIRNRNENDKLKTNYDELKKLQIE